MQLLDVPGIGGVEGLETGIREVIVVPPMGDGVQASQPNEAVRATAETNPPPPVNAASKTPLVWGKEVNGLRAAFECIPEKKSYSI